MRTIGGVNLDSVDRKGCCAEARRQDSRGAVVVEGVLEIVVVNSMRGWLRFLFAHCQKHLLSFTWTWFTGNVVDVLLLPP